LSRKYAAIFESAQDNWAAYVPDLPGCITTGKTVEETERNIREAIRGLVSPRRSKSLRLPKPTPSPSSLENVLA
jgi:predicted RNase H-like HicB family nuclease